MSLATGYIKGLSLGQQLMDAERQRKRDELSDELIRERIEDQRLQRKTLLAQLNEQEAERKRRGVWQESGARVLAAQQMQATEGALSKLGVPPEVATLFTEQVGQGAYPEYARTELPPGLSLNAILQRYAPKENKPEEWKQKRVQRERDWRELTGLQNIMGPFTPQQEAGLKGRQSFLKSELEIKEPKPEKEKSFRETPEYKAFYNIILDGELPQGSQGQEVPIPSLKKKWSEATEQEKMNLLRNITRLTDQAYQQSFGGGEGGEMGGEIPEEYKSTLSAYGNYDEFETDATQQLNEGSISQEAFDNAVAYAKLYWKK